MFSHQIIRSPVCTLSSDEKNILNEYISSIAYRKDQGVKVFIEPDENSVLSFLDRCEDIRCLYRNAAAHTEMLSRDEAVACCHDVIGINRPQASNNVGMIQGLIYDLVKLAKNPFM